MRTERSASSVTSGFADHPRRDGACSDFVDAHAHPLIIARRVDKTGFYLRGNSTGTAAAPLVMFSILHEPSNTTPLSIASAGVSKLPLMRPG